MYLFELGQNDSWEQVEVFRSPDRRKYDPDGNDLFFGFGYFLIGSAGLDGIKGRRAKDIGALYVNQRPPPYDQRPQSKAIP